MKRIVLLTGLILAIGVSVVAQKSGMDGGQGQTSPQGGKIVGMVVDAKTQQSIEYANIAVYLTKDSSLVTGGITDTEGKFNINSLKPGEYYATVMFIGYVQTVKSDIVISEKQAIFKLGKIDLHTDAQNLNEVEVMADRQQVQFKIDKKVVNPSQFLAAQGGTAVDILANTPSITVDVEGNVNMRGSSNFMVLINGKPTPFEASDALAQIPASTIENIEIITNPSAKYDPDGAAGIINIITKNDAQGGWNGIVNASASTLGSYSGDFLFNFTGDRTRWYFGGNRRDRLRYADYSNGSGTIDLASGDTSHILQVGERSMNFISNSLKTGIEYDLNKKNTIGIELEGGNSGRNFISDLENYEWTTGTSKTKSYSEAVTKARGTFGSFTLSQYSQFGNDKEHKLESSFFYQFYQGDDDTYSDKVDVDEVALVVQETWEESKSSELRFKTDYTRPLENGKIEAGYQLRIDDQWSNYDAYFDTLTTPIDFYSENNFYRMINSAYGTFSGESGQFGYQLGLRAEHTLRQLVNKDDSLVSDINRLDWYPSVHLSYNLTEFQSFMTSYTRRIDRPRGHYLDPYLMWRDPNNVRQGNPDLLPQYVNSYELSYQLRFGQMNFLSAELFHRNVTDKIERVRSKYADGVLLTSRQNVGQDFSTGLELMLNYNLTKWWSANLSGSLYDYRMDVYDEFVNSVNETQSNNWSARLSNTFKPDQTFRIQFDAMYSSPSITATGTRSAMAFTSLAVKKSFFNRKLDLGVSVIDIFDTAKMNMEGSGSTYYTDYEFDMKSPYLQFTLTYLFNNFKQERSRGGGEGMEMEF